ncbi:MAG: hypothetical protein Q4B42_04050 [Oscillospiraceae bacterium]|nr:hypothetical protein [Oscillospiraceae bacterium]
MNFQLFLQTLPYMGLGMLGIFAVTLVIILCITLLNKFTSGKEE